MAKLPYALTIVLVLVRTVAHVKAESDDESIDLSEMSEAIFGNPDMETTGRLVDAQGEESLQNPEELGTYYEGDILIPVDYRKSRNEDRRNGLLALSTRWPGGVVPYEIKGTFTSQELDNINHAFKEYHYKTCIRFRQRTKEKDYISITNSKSGCWSSIGRIGGKQEVNLQSPNCLRTYGTPIHELMHALGFLHEQNRHERDNYVKVLSENVKPGLLVNFEKGSSKTHSGFGIEYDYASVMHYSSTSFSKNGKPTLVALRSHPDARQLGQRRGFSPSDVRKINLMYKCRL